jgi:transcriptional regulator GlxA family with amidase domain
MTEYTRVTYGTAHLEVAPGERELTDVEVQRVVKRMNEALERSLRQTVETQAANLTPDKVDRLFRRRRRGCAIINMDPLE